MKITILNLDDGIIIQNYNNTHKHIIIDAISGKGLHALWFLLL